MLTSAVELATSVFGCDSIKSEIPSLSESGSKKSGIESASESLGIHSAFIEKLALLLVASDKFLCTKVSELVR